MESCSILIGGDICPTDSNCTMFENGEVEILFDKLVTNFRNNDLNIINLECPLISQKDPIYKMGPSLGASTKCINALKKAEINMINIGNNHIMDHGISGIRNTIGVLEKNNIGYVGIGENINIAKKMKIQNIKKFNIGILSITETGFYNAKKDSMGTAPIDIIDMSEEIIKKRDNCDYIIALIHGGVEHYPYPSPKNQKLSRFLIKCGVDCVIWQHSHCPGYIEKYNEKYIVYGQGNLVFDLGRMHSDWHKGYAVEVILKKDKKNNIKTFFNIIPFIQSFNKPGIYVLENKQKQKFIDEIFSKKINLEEEVENEWEKFCNKQKEWYLAELIGYEHLLKKDKSLKMEKNLNSRLFKQLGIDDEELIKLRNLMFCESHNEMIKKSLELYIKEKHLNNKE